MTQRRKPRKYTDEFREEAVKLVTEQDYSVTEAAKSLGITTKLLYNWKDKLAKQAWAGDITYLKTHQGWMYLAVVMDLHSRRIIGWALNKRMTVDLTIRAMQMAINLRQPKAGLIFHSDRGSQYTSKRFQTLLWANRITPSMSGCGACLDNAVVERFFGSLKNEWLLNVYHLTRESMTNDVEKYIKYYNSVRLHTTLNDMSPIEFESVRKKCAA